MEFFRDCEIRSLKRIQEAGVLFVPHPAHQAIGVRKEETPNSHNEPRPGSD